MQKALRKAHRLEKIFEALTWIVVILILIFIRFFPRDILDKDVVFLFIGGIISFALLYYWVLFKWLTKTGRLWLKSIADVIFIGILIHLLKDYEQYFFALYFLPIAAISLSLNLINGLLIATVASLIIALEFFIQGKYELSENLYSTIWQISFLIFITLFCRFLAIDFRHEKEIRKDVEEKLIDADKMTKDIEAREKEFVSMTSHQLFTPLSIIRGYCSNLLAGHMGKLNSEQEKYLNSIHGSTKNMIDIVNELITISRLESKKVNLDLKPVDINETINKAIDHLKIEFDYKKIPLVFEQISLPKIFADEKKVCEVIVNLMDNAIRYSNGKKITIETSIGKDKYKSDVIVSIIDQGNGIPANEQKNIFKEFFHATNNEKKGTGLGLYIAKSLIKKQNGDIWFKSNENKGSTFSFALPIAK